MQRIRSAQMELYLYFFSILISCLRSSLSSDSVCGSLWQKSNSKSWCVLCSLWLWLTCHCYLKLCAAGNINDGNLLFLYIYDILYINVQLQYVVILFLLMRHKSVISSYLIFWPLVKCKVCGCIHVSYFSCYSYSQFHLTNENLNWKTSFISPELTPRRDINGRSVAYCAVFANLGKRST